MMHLGGNRGQKRKNNPEDCRGWHCAATTGTIAAQDAGKFADEIVPVPIEKTRKAVKRII